MGIGGSIFLIAVGAIVAFGVRDQTLGPLDLNVIGWVLMLAGFAGLVITLWVWNSRKRRVATTVPTHEHVERETVQGPPNGAVSEHHAPADPVTDWRSSTPPDRRP
jgi:Domain of unknown function (DUF6458)